MQVLPISFYTQIQPTFQGRGKPIDLKYALEKRADLIPSRVLEEARKVLQSGGSESLRDIHLRLYAPLLGYTTLEEVRENYPEFAGIKDAVVFERDTVRKRKFEERTDGINFPLKMLQELWGKLKTKDEVAQELGMAGRSTLDWALENIDFVYYPKNYKTLLKASDEQGNREIAQKTAAWNALHPDLMYAHNKHAAQGCKTPKYRAAQAQRMYEYDKEHPERREKISEANRRAWARCPEVREAMAEFACRESAFTRRTIMKCFRGEPLTAYETRAEKGFFKRFWAAHPELISVYTEAKKGSGEATI